jgi:hypothetical protein
LKDPQSSTYYYFAPVETESLELPKTDPLDLYVDVELAGNLSIIFIVKKKKKNGNKNSNLNLEFSHSDWLKFGRG